MLLKFPINISLESLPFCVGLVILGYAYALDAKYTTSTHGCYGKSSPLNYFAVYVYVPLVTGLCLLGTLRPNLIPQPRAFIVFGLFSMIIFMRMFYSCRSINESINAHANVHPHPIELKKSYSKTMRLSVFQLASYLETLEDAGTYVQRISRAKDATRTIVHATRQRLIEYDASKARQRGFR